MIVCEGVLEPCGFIGVDVQAFLGLGPGCSTGCHNYRSETKTRVRRRQEAQPINVLFFDKVEMIQLKVYEGRKERGMTF